MPILIAFERIMSDEAAPAPAAEEGVKMYVGNLSFDTTEDTLRSTFGEFGTVTDVFLPVHRDSGTPRGFAFVTLSERDAAEKAIAAWDGKELDGRTLKVNESKPKVDYAAGGGGFNSAGLADVKLYVGNLSYESTEESVRAAFAQYGEISDCFLPTDRESGAIRGFAFVTMAAADAEKALAMDGAEIDGRAVKVNESQPKRGGGRGGGRGYGGRGGGYGRGRGGGGRGYY